MCTGPKAVLCEPVSCSNEVEGRPQWVTGSPWGTGFNKLLLDPRLIAELDGPVVRDGVVDFEQPVLAVDDHVGAENLDRPRGWAVVQKGEPDHVIEMLNEFKGELRAALDVEPTKPVAPPQPDVRAGVDARLVPKGEPNPDDYEGGWEDAAIEEAAKRVT